MDVVETNDKICYHFDLPGVADKDDINLSVDNNVLRMNCDKPQVCCLAHTPEERMNLAYHRHERSWGKYDRYVLSIALHCIALQSIAFHCCNSLLVPPITSPPFSSQ